MMPSSFHPTGNGDYLLIGDDHDLNIAEIKRHSPHDADAYDRHHHDLNRVCQAIQPLFDNPPPNIFGKDADDLADVEWLLSHLGSVERKVMHDTVRLLTGSAADWLDDYFENEAVKGFHASSSIIGSKVGPMSPGSGLVMLFHKMGEHDGHLGSWAFHKGGNGGFTQVLARAAQAYGAEIRLESPVTAVTTKDGRVAGVALEDGTQFQAPVVVSALDPRRTFLELVEPRELPSELVENVERFRFQGTSGKVNFALDGLPTFPALPDTSDHYGGFINIGPTIEYVERAFDDAKYGWYSCSARSGVTSRASCPWWSVLVILSLRGHMCNNLVYARPPAALTRPAPPERDPRACIRPARVAHISERVRYLEDLDVAPCRNSTTSPSAIT